MTPTLFGAMPPFWDRTFATFNLGTDPFRHHPAILEPSFCVLRPSHLHRVCLFPLASLCALLSSLLGADPFQHHPAILGPNLNVLQPNDQLFSAPSTYKYVFFIPSLISQLLHLYFTGTTSSDRGAKTSNSTYPSCELDVLQTSNL